MFGFSFKDWASFIGLSQMAFGTKFVNKTNAFTYMVCTVGIKSKKYVVKNLFTSVTNIVATYTQILHATFAILT